MPCAKCGFSNPEGMNFCGQCGARLAAAPESPPARVDESGAARAERRQLTVLFCDLVGSTSIADRLDPEDYRDLVNGYHALVSREVDRFGGRIAQYLGDGVLIYFGHPIAHEDDADRAVRAAQRIVEAVAAAPTHRYSVRAGLHTGRVVVGAIGAGSRQESLALGPTPNVAARIQQLAEPNTVLLSAATLRLLKGGFATTDLGEQQLRGMSVPMKVYRIDASDEGAFGRRADLENRPLVDRFPQRERLDELWVRVEAGRSVGVVLRGEAGIGKSRLAHWFLTERVGAARFFAHCSARHEHSGLYPLIELLRFELGLDRAASEARVASVVRSELEELALDEPFVDLLLTALLSGNPPGSEVADLSAPLRRSLVHGFFGRWLRTRAGERPVLLVVDDAHWADPSTLDWIADFVARPPSVGETSSGAMVVLTARPEPLPHVAVAEGAGWDSVEIDRLEEEYVQEMLDTLGVGDALDRDTREELLDKTDGVPLFVEELTHMMLDDPRPGSDSSSIPSSLEDLLMARLDRLGAAKVTAQWASAIGRTFSVELLSDVVPYSRSELDQQVDALLASGIFDRIEGEGLRFRHALIQEAAYLALLRSERRDFHRAIAAVLEAQTVTGSHRRPEQIARHFREAGEGESASRFYFEAGSLALARSDNREAVALLRESLACLVDTPEGSARTSRELQCYLALGAALVAIKGYGASEVSEVHAAAHDRSHEIQDGRESFVALRSTLPYYLVRSEMDTALRVGEELVEMARSLGDDGLLLEAHTSVATPCFWRGEVARARLEAETALQLYDGERHRGHAARFGQDPGVLSLLYRGWSSWWLGDLAVAEESAARAVEMARELEHKHTLAMALDHACSLHLYLRSHAEARRLIDEARAVAGEYGFAMWAAMGTFRSAWLDCVEGRPESGIEQMELSLAAFHRTGANIARPLHLAYLAEAFAAVGRTAAGLDAVAEGLSAAHDSGELHHEPELLRLRGLLTIATEPGTGFQDLLRARELARERGCRSLALRAATSAVEHAPVGEEAPSREALASIVAGFPGGLESVDLDAARVWLK